MHRLTDCFRGSLSGISAGEPSSSPQRDDLDLAAMGKAALNYLRGNPDPARDYECRFALGPLGIPCHVPISPSNRYGFDVVSLGDTDCRMDWQYAHMREMAGQDHDEPVERGVRARILGYLRDDHCAWINPAAYIGETVDEEWIGTWTTAKILRSLSEEYQRTRDESLKARARRIFLALRKLAIWEGGKAYYWGIAPYRNGEWLKRGWCAGHARNYPFIVEPCVRYYECTDDEEALELASAFTEGFLSDVQPEMGEQRIDPATGAFKGHVHLHTHAVWGVAHLGVLLNEPRYLDWAEKVYRFVLANGTDYGWYPEFIPQPEYRTEICAVGDMISIAVWLARGGKAEYWDHIERTVRNELRASQFFLTPTFVGLFRRVHEDKSEGEIEQALTELRKLEGGFVAQATFDDWVSYPDNPRLGTPGLGANGIQMMGCCPPEGMRGLWEAWNGTVEERPEGVFVNMALSRHHAAVKVTAFRPQDGRLSVEAKKAAAYFLRPPAWVDRDAVRLLRDGRNLPVSWGGPGRAYVVVSDVKPGENLSLTYPVPTLAQTFSPTSVAGRQIELTVRWAGNTVVGVQPHGEYLPMFDESRA